MKRQFIVLIIACAFSQILFAKSNNIFIVFYATAGGKTGHLGIAVDNYKIVFKEVKKSNKIIQQTDTIASGELTYYDFWPNDDDFNVSRTGTDIPGVYYKLPVSSVQNSITINSLYDSGIPHKEHYPSDGLLKIPTNWQQDQWMISFLDSTIKSNRLFNAQLFNCSDFVRLPLEKLLNTKLESSEFVLTGWSTTPNKLYQCLRKLNNIEVIKNADDKAAHSFIEQRIFYKLFHKTTL